MRLVHPGIARFFILLGALWFMAGCSPPKVTEDLIAVQINADGESHTVTLPAGSTVDNALNAAGIVPATLDRADPPLYTVLSDGSKIRLVRVREEFTVEQQVIAFDHQELRNESLPAGQEYWLQLGQNGLQEITTRHVYEDDVEVSSNPVKTVVIKEAIPQIKMIGVQKPFAPISIPGRLAYLAEGNAWLMEGSTGNRRQVVNTGDLDGRIFSLSPDGKWLLFTRSSADENVINTLWVVGLEENTAQPIDLGVANVVHFADWRPGVSQTVAYSTVEPRPSAPGWQANNDLGLLSFSESGFVRPMPLIIEANSGGVYGWWGTTYTWAPEGMRLVYSRPDGVGLFDIQSVTIEPVVELAPVQTFGDWAWVSGAALGPEGEFLYAVKHDPPAESTKFDLLTVPLSGGTPVTIVPDVGMFAYPLPSPLRPTAAGEKGYQVAYLQAFFPAQSENSRYRLMVMDRDGSNRQALFPLEGAAGLEPQRVNWSPRPLEGNSNLALAFIYQNNLWLVDSVTGEAWQITGDGLTSRVDWK